MGALAPPAPDCAPAALPAVPTLLIHDGTLTSTAPAYCSAVLKTCRVSPAGKAPEVKAEGGDVTMSTRARCSAKRALTVTACGDVASGASSEATTSVKKASASPASRTSNASSRPDAAGPTCTTADAVVTEGSCPFFGAAPSSIDFQYRPRSPADAVNLKPESFVSVQADCWPSDV